MVFDDRALPPHDSANSPPEDRAEKREVLSAKISALASDSLRSFCARHGVTVTAVLEVGGRLLAQETNPPTIEYRQSIISRARKIDLSRRSRRRTQQKVNPAAGVAAAGPANDNPAQLPADRGKEVDRSEEREILSAKISAHALEGWRSFCALSGISLTAMLEIVCHDLGEGTLPTSDEARQQLVASAREVDLARRSRSARK